MRKTFTLTRLLETNKLIIHILTISRTWHVPHIKVQKIHIIFEANDKNTRMHQSPPRLFCGSCKFLPDYSPNFDQRFSGQCAIPFPLADKQLKMFSFFPAFPKANTEQLTYLQNSSASLYIKIETSWLHVTSPACLHCFLSLQIRYHPSFSKDGLCCDN